MFERTARCIPERTQEGLVQLACPHRGGGSLERGWEPLRRSAMKQTHVQRQVQFDQIGTEITRDFKDPRCRINGETKWGWVVVLGGWEGCVETERHENYVRASGNLPPGGSVRKRSNLRWI